MSSLITTKKSIREFYNASGTTLPPNSLVVLDSGVSLIDDIPRGRLGVTGTDRTIGIALEETENNTKGEAIYQGIVAITLPSGVSIYQRIYWDLTNNIPTSLPNQYPVGYVASITPSYLYVDIVGSEISPGDDLRVKDIIAETGYFSDVFTVENAITLNNVSNPTDTNADGGGLILLGDTPKTFLYNSLTNSWETAPNINLPSGGQYRVNNQEYFSTKTTDNLSEGALNLYYKDTLFDNSFSNKSTDDLTEGSVNKYFTDSKAKIAVISQSVSEGVIDKSPSEDAIYNYIKDSVSSEEIIFNGEITNTNAGVLNDIAITSYSFIRFINATEVTGFIAPTGVNHNKVIFLTNENSVDILIKNDDAGSASSNRILTGTSANITLKATSAIGLIYDRLSLRWKILGGTGSGGGGGGSSFEVSQVNTFTKGQPIYFDGSDWQLADTSEITKVGVAVISETGNPFIGSLSGTIELDSAEITALIGSATFTPGTTYYVSDTPGLLTSLSPAISNPILKAISTTKALIQPGFVASSNGVGQSILRQQFTAGVSQTTYTLDFEPLGLSYITVTLDGIDEYDFTYSGTDVILGEAPPENTEVTITYVKCFKLDTRNNIYPFRFTATASQTVFNLPVAPDTVASLWIKVNNVEQETSFSLVGNVVTFDTPLSDGDIVSGRVVKDVNFSQGIDNFITRKTIQLVDDAETTIEDIFGENISGEYRIKLSGNMRTNATGWLDVGTDADFFTISGNVTNTYGTDDKLNIDYNSDTIRIQNQLGGTRTIIVVREL